MRRSYVVTLTILAASGAALYGCSGDDVDAMDYVVTDETSCVERYGAEAQADCNAALVQAREQHLATAPRYASMEACQEATGSACETTPATRPADKPLLGTAAAAGASLAIPVLAGVMIGRMMDNGAGRMTTPLYAGRAPGECAPGGAGMGRPDCAPSRSGGTSSGSGGRFFYSGTNYAGSTSAPVGRTAAAFTASPGMASTISSGSGSFAGRASSASVSRGGFGASARGHSGGS
ncbi:MAG: hypothetical protein JWR10_3964 [Rubritepida sp.]|nr:hypothetical protein [Rubritepida sp.]